MAALVRVVVSVADLERATAFYRAVLGVNGRDRGPGVFGLDVGGVELLLHERPPVPSDTAVTASFGVPDVDTATAEVLRRGGGVVDPPADQPWGERQAVVRDPDGHVLCLVAAVG